MSFNELGLAEPLLKAIADAGYDTPTPIQKQAIPAVLQGGDLLAGAQTGTGKTAGFTLPLLHRLMHTPAQRVGGDLQLQVGIFAARRGDDSLELGLLGR